MLVTLLVRVFALVEEPCSTLGLGISLGLLPGFGLLLLLPPLSNRSLRAGSLDSSAALALTSCMASANESTPSLVVGDEEVGLGVETLSVLLTAAAVFVDSLLQLLDCSPSKVLHFFSLSSSRDDEESITLGVLIRLDGLGGPPLATPLPESGGVTLPPTASDEPPSGVELLLSDGFTSEDVSSLSSWFIVSLCGFFFTDLAGFGGGLRREVGGVAEDDGSAAAVDAVESKVGAVLHEVGGVSVVTLYGFLEGDSAGEFGCEFARMRKFLLGLRGKVLTSLSCALLLEVVPSGDWLSPLGIVKCFVGLSGPFDPRVVEAVLLHGNVAERPISTDFSSRNPIFEGFGRGLGGRMGFLMPDFGLEPTLATISLPLEYGD